MLLGTRS